MKALISIATGVLIMTSPAADAAPRPAVQHYGNPTLNGQPLPFSEAVRVGDVLYLSGQLGRGPDGKLPDGIEAQTKQTLDNIGATLKLAGLTHADIVDTTVYLPDTWQQPQVAKVLREPISGTPTAGSVVGARLAARAGLVELVVTAWR